MIKKLLTPTMLSVKTSEPANNEDILFAERSGVIGSSLLPMKRIGALVLFAPAFAVGASQYRFERIKLSSRSSRRSAGNTVTHRQKLDS